MSTSAGRTATALLEFYGLRLLPGGKADDSLVSVMNVGFILLNLSLLYLIARKRARERDEPRA